MVPISKEGRKAVIELVVERNTLILAAQISQGHPSPTLFWMIDPETFEPVRPKRHKWSKGRKSDDVIAAAVANSAVLYAKHGADAVRITEDGEIEYIELKLAIVERENYWINDNGTIYTGHGYNSDNRSALTSNVSGGFSHIGNAEEKRRPTYLVVMTDEHDVAVVGCWRLEADVVFDCLTKNQVKRIKPLSEAEREKKSKKREIKLCTFLTKGTETGTSVPAIGLDELKRLIREENRRSPHERGIPAPPPRKSKLKIVIDSQHRDPYVGVSKEIK